MTPETKTPEQIEQERVAAAAATASEALAAEQLRLRNLAVTEERTRISEIHAATRVAKLPPAFGETLVTDGKTIDQARAAIITELARLDPNAGAGSQITITGADEKDKKRDAIECALLNRADPTNYPTKDLKENAREYRGASLIEIAREVLDSNGTRTRGMSKSEVVDRALGTTDYPNMLAAVVNKIMMKAYSTPPQTWRPLSRQIDASDFKAISAIQFGGTLKLEKVKEGGEIKSGKLAENKETWKIETYGKIVAITRQAIINDDLGGFTRVALIFGQSAANLENDIMWGLINSNPVMGDTKNLFHTGHKNLAGTGTVMSVAALSAARVALRKQTGMDTELLNLQMKYLVVPPELETLADQLVSPIYQPITAETVNVFQSRLQVISDPRLTNATKWYLTTSPDQIDMLVHSYLDGEAGLHIENRYGFDVDGIEIKARKDFGGGIMDYRGFYQNPGA